MATNKGHNLAHLSGHSLALKYGAFFIEITFLEGGGLDLPESVFASAGGGVYAEGLTASYLVEGVASLTPTLAKTILAIYRREGVLPISSAIHSTFLSQQKMLRTVSFANAVVSKIPDPTFDVKGSDGRWRLVFSLADVVDISMESIEV